MSKAKREHVTIAFEESPAPALNVKPVVPGVATLRDIAVVPAPGDNCAIATRRIEKGTQVKLEGRDDPVTLPNTVLEAHRICSAPNGIPAGDALLSWGLPFGFALKDIAPGEYIMNESMLQALRIRQLDFPLPDTFNFEDRLESLNIDKDQFVPATPTEKYQDSTASFQGYMRHEARGAGTRNSVVILGLTSLAGSFVKLLEAEIKEKGKIDLGEFKNIDSVVSISHTEGGTTLTPINNIHFIMRALGGWIVHPNVGAVLIVVDETHAAFSAPPPSSSSADGVDHGASSGSTLLTYEKFSEFLRANNYPMDHVPHRVLQLQGNFRADIKTGLENIRELLPVANQAERSDVPLRYLKIAMQCGGSDAFSGVSANPLAGWAVMEVIKHGGSANLAETDELMGAEPYIVRGTTSLPLAHEFLRQVEWFKRYAGWHGHTAETNPSGGNKFRGLYNIALKSLGAAMKKNPNVSLDAVVDYAERMTTPGYYFMNSPGNDLESIAGQVASGCNLIYFTTGNGSVTNFPFVPTIKIVTTSGRFRLLSKDMDINAGEYIDGTPMPELGKRLFQYTVDVASGLRSTGERAGHSQVSIWRNWLQVDASRLEALEARPESLSGVSILAKQTGLAGTSPIDTAVRSTKWKALYDPTHKRYVSRQTGLILPTSLCSSQVAQLITKKMNAGWQAKRDEGDKETNVLSGFVALPHTEGCGASPGLNEVMFRRTMLGHLVHPSIRYGLLLEHGCEKTHNDYMSMHLQTMGASRDQFGWASVQLDGGIDAVTSKVMSWFEKKIQDDAASPHQEVEVGLEHVRLGLFTSPGSSISIPMARALGHITRCIVDAGGLVVIPQNASLLQTWTFLNTIDANSSGKITTPVMPSLGYGQAPASGEQGGFHVMQTVTDHHVETVTGLGASGVEIILYVTEQDTRAIQTHPIIPVIQVTTTKTKQLGAKPADFEDFDVVLEDEGTDEDARVSVYVGRLLSVVSDTLSRRYTPKLSVNYAFQIARDSLAIST
eukprot:TRINITY_DN2491_c0_g1_i4.p1 TRINITY_DN2491_c0_g1~~TRINITY_DN2491_c0_g1_i4.p1  ORF type:complete len:1005 (+),score=322.97 TRINITY_DN2491_c0_g1_i4:85-3099(+)